MDKLIQIYADRLESIYDNRTAGDSTFSGILSEFAERVTLLNESSK